MASLLDLINTSLRTYCAAINMKLIFFLHLSIRIITKILSVGEAGTTLLPSSSRLRQLSDNNFLLRCIDHFSLAQIITLVPLR